jgi:ketosteroid isomerase-like protein
MRIRACLGQAFVLGVLLTGGCEPADRSDADDHADRSSPSAPNAAAQVSPVPALPADAGGDEAELVRLEQLYAKALIARDRAFLMRFYAPDWRGGNWMGFWSKSTMLKSVLDERYIVRSMTLRDLRVRRIGDVAIVQGVDEEVTSVDGRNTSGKWTFTDIFARRAGAWVAVASHTSEVRPTGE